ncbi:MAG: PD-(D/E)XK nuclease family protein [Candidatus Cloacimonetes bacterium]|nr:PD-(D/E)XK nuclease family protein [Candidatus Cloacimonadota bacterium]
MLHYKFLPITADLAEILSESEVKHKALIVFPNHKSMNIAVSRILSRWALQEIEFITMEQLNEITSLTEKPALQDAKRYLMLYQSLDSKIKEKYRLTDYLSAKTFFGQFFQLFTEIHDECVNSEEIQQKLIEQGFFSDWQMDTWADMLQMYDDYAAYLRDTGFTDSIFAESEGFSSATNSFLHSFESIIFANQFYFSQKEIKCLRALGETKEVTLYYLLPENLYDPETFAVKPFTLLDILPAAESTPKCYLYSTLNPFTQLNKAIEIAGKREIKTIVDYDFISNDRYTTLSSEKFALAHRYSFTESSIYNFFKVFYNLLKSMRSAEKSGKSLIPLHLLFSAFQSEPFRRFFSIADSDALIDYFRAMVSANFLYLDPFSPDRLLAVSDSCYREAILSFCDLFRRLLNVKQMNQLIDLIDANNGFRIDDICSPNERDFTDSRDVFYESTSYIYSIEELNVLSDWHQIFTDLPQKPIICDILAFYLDYLRPLMVSYKAEKTGKISVMTLVDTRNIVFDKIIFMNLVEGVLPKAKSVDFLFNDQQRSIIGLKTYSEVALREKYYFYRAMLSSQECHLFYMENEEENIAKSSFIEELNIYYPAKLELSECADSGYISFYKTDQKRPLTPNPPPSRFTLPADFATDFALPNVLRFSVTELENFLDYALDWYLAKNLQFEKQTMLTDDTLNYMLIGKFTHILIENVYHRIAAKKNAVTFADWLAAMTEDTLNSIFHDMTSHSAAYKFPQDFSHKFFAQLLYPVIKKNVLAFFCSENFRNIPPQSTIKIEFDTPEKLLLDRDDCIVYLHGKPDMMISDSTNKKRYVIDFKTGKASADQLYLYEWLLTNDEPWTYRLYFLYLFDSSSPALSPEKSQIQKTIDRLDSTLDKCKNFGYENRKKRWQQ